MLYDHGLSIGSYGSKRYQFEKGENRAGVEIKFDQRWRETGNLYIETDEKAHPSRPSYTRSGIYRNDNSWLYVIGDRSKVFIFAKSTLQRVDKAMRGGSERYQHVSTATSKGFLVPVEEGEKLAAKVIEPKSKP